MTSVVFQFPESCRDTDPWLEFGKKLRYISNYWEQGIINRYELISWTRLAIIEYERHNKQTEGI